MIDRYRRLAERIRSELSDVEREVNRAQKSWQVVHTTADPEPYIDSVALNLHGFYSGSERLFEQIAAQVDDKTPEGGFWHVELLEQMAREMPDVRPAVISVETANALDEFRKFRHLVRNVYTANLDPARMKELLAALPSVWAQLTKELSAFASFLDRVGQDEEE